MTLRQYLEEQINEGLKQAVLSNRRAGEGPTKVRIRPVALKGDIFYQASSTEGTKVFHKNYRREEAVDFLEDTLQREFGQLQAVGRELDGTVLVSKKGKVTVLPRKHTAAEPVQIQAHNRVKQYILKEGVPVPFLIDLGVMNTKGKVVS